MTQPIAIDVQNISKQYFIGRRSVSSSLVDAVAQGLSAPFRRAWNLLSGQAAAAADLDEAIWALRDVSFQIPTGQVVGVIGRNGAGKSTLLKILSRITQPTTGLAILRGRVGSLLEVGTGFHPELTGRDNVYLSGAIIGMRRAEIDQRFDEIVEFSGIRKFIDTPVKHYSSGMYVRLAFAVAAHLEPEVMLIDEVLSVGDAEFQKKCLGKLGNVARGGRTVLFVSHNMMAVQSLCERVIWLDEGRIREDGDPSAVISHYLATATEAQAPQRTWDDIESAPGNRQVRLRHISVAPEGGSPGEPITVRNPITLEFEYWNLIAGARLNLSLVVYNAQGIALFNTYPSPDTPLLTDLLPKGLFRSTCIIPGDLLNDGDHRVELYIVRDQREVIYHDEAILTFTVLDSTELRSAWYGKVIGLLRPLLTWDTELVAELQEKPTV